MDYNEFLNNKVIKHFDEGIDVELSDLNNYLFDYEKSVVKWQLKKGKSCCFAGCGMGKTAIQVEWIKQITDKTNCNGLILTPLSVSFQTIKEAEKMGYKINHLKSGKVDKIDICNYEYLEHVDISRYNAIVLDESSILKSFMGKTKQLIFDLFQNYQYKACFTATPSPNDEMEILNHGEFVTNIRSCEALSMFYINDTMNFGNYRLKKHAENDFFNWLSSWTVAFENPSDIGFDGSKHILPKLNEHYIEIQPDLDNDTDNLFGYREVNAINYNKLKRDTIEYKTEKIKEILKKIDGQTVIWCYNNAETDYLKKHIKNSVEVRGSDSNDKKEQAAIDFVNGKIRILISKSSIFGFGMNFQNCHNVIYCGLSFSYEEYYQSVRRFWRYGQKNEVNIYIVLSHYEKSIYDTINNKKELHDKLKKGMMFLNNDFFKKELKMEYVVDSYEHEAFTLVNGDSVEEIKKIPDESMGFSIFSPPFSQLYIYSDSYRDMGNVKNDNEFIQHFEFLVKDLFRIMKSGRLVAVHCKNLVNYKGRDGRSGLRDFRGDIIRLFERCDFQYHSEVCIWKDPVIEMQRTKSHGLLYKQLRKDSSYSRQGLPDYLVIFRKWTDKGDVSPINWKTHDNFKLDKWQEYASPIVKVKDNPKDIGNELRQQFELWERDLIEKAWFDIKQTNVLNIREARANEDEKHICPLQLDVIERALELWTNPGDTVFTPFLGIGSEIYQSLLMKRKGYGIELKKEYYEKSINNCLYAYEKSKEEDLSLFDDAEGEF